MVPLWYRYYNNHSLHCKPKTRFWPYIKFLKPQHSHQIWAYLNRSRNISSRMKGPISGLSSSETISLYGRKSGGLVPWLACKQDTTPSTKSGLENVSKYALTSVPSSVLLSLTALLRRFTTGCSEDKSERLISDPSSHAYNLLTGRGKMSNDDQRI